MSMIKIHGIYSASVAHRLFDLISEESFFTYRTPSGDYFLSCIYGGPKAREAKEMING